MHTTEVIITLARKLGISQASARKLLHERFAVFSQSLLKESSVDLPGLGKIETQQTKERRQYIPSKQSYCLVPSHRRAAFKVNTLFKARLRRTGP